MPENTTGTLDPGRDPGKNQVDYEFCGWGVKLKQTYVLPSETTVDLVYLTNKELSELATLAQQRGLI